MLRNYFKTAIKVLRRRRFFTFISMFAITLTLVVLIVSSAMLDFVFASHRPERYASRSLGVYAMGLYGESRGKSALGGYRVLDSELRNLPGSELVTLVRMNSTITSFVNGQKVKSFMKLTDGDFWRVYDFRFLEGGPFTTVDEANANKVVVINDATRRVFFGDATAVGKVMDLDGQRFRVAGVVESVPDTRLVPFADIWAPISTSPSQFYKREYVGNFMGVVVARDRRFFPAMKKEFATRIARIKPDEPLFDRVVAGLDTQFEAMSRVMFASRLESSHPGILQSVIVVMAVLFMLLPAVNLMNISVSRMMERSEEIGIRKAFGASSWTIVNQFVIENVLVTLMGGLLSLIIAQLVLSILNRSSLVLYGDFHLNWRIFLYSLVLAVVFGVVSSVYPAWKMSRLHPIEALHGRQR